MRGSLTPRVAPRQIPIRLLPHCVSRSGQALVPLVSARDLGMTQIDLLMLKTEDLVSEPPEEKKSAPMPGEHGSMGGDMY